MRLKFLTMLALSGMVYASCSSNKSADADSSATTSDTAMVDTAMTDTLTNSSGQVDSVSSGVSGSGKGNNVPGAGSASNDMVPNGTGTTGTNTGSGKGSVTGTGKGSTPPKP